MKYEVVHTTEYEYSEPVAVSHHVARLRPRTLHNQQCLDHTLDIEPAPAVATTYDDYFGNGVTFFAMQGAHKRLTIRARTTCVLSPPSLPAPAQTVPWETAANLATLPVETTEFLFSGGL